MYSANMNYYKERIFNPVAGKKIILLPSVIKDFSSEITEYLGNFSFWFIFCNYPFPSFTFTFKPVLFELAVLVIPLNIGLYLHRWE